jgi:chloride channel 2
METQDITEDAFRYAATPQRAPRRTSSGRGPAGDDDDRSMSASMSTASRARGLQRGMLGSSLRMFPAEGVGAGLGLYGAGSSPDGSPSGAQPRTPAQPDVEVVVIGDPDITSPPGNTNLVFNQSAPGKIVSQSLVESKADQVPLASVVASLRSRLAESIAMAAKAEEGVFVEQLGPEDDAEAREAALERRGPRVPQTKAEVKMRMFRLVRGGVHTWLFLLLLGSSAALFASLIQQALLLFARVRAMVIYNSTSWGTRYFDEVAYATILGLAAVTVVQMMSALAGGSGIPEMKSILSGNAIPNYLSWRTGIAKFIGLVLTLASGMSVGRDGPYVHIMCVISHRMTKLRIFSGFKKVEALRLQMLSAACACGIAGTFNTPIGGVLFTMEVTATYFMVSNIWKLFFAAVCGAVVGTLINPLLNTNEPNVFFTDFPAKHFGKAEYLAFGVLGIAAGVAGAIFVWLVDLCVLMRMKYSKKGVTPHVWVLIAATGTAIACYPFPFLRVNQLKAINQMFQPTLDPVWSQQMDPNYALIVNAVVRFVTGFYSTTLPVPVGVLQPVFSFGAAMGRMYGDLVSALLGPEFDVFVGGYAIVAAAAMGSGVTRTLSTAILVFELTGNLTHMLPILIAVIFSVGVGNMLTYSFFDILLIRKGLPFLSADMVTSVDEVFTAKDVMSKDFPFITLNSTYRDIVRILESSTLAAIPVVDSRVDMLLIGAMQRSVAVSLIEDKRVDTLETIPELDPRLRKGKSTFLKLLTPITAVFEVANEGLEVLTAGSVQLPYMGKGKGKGKGKGRGRGKGKGRGGGGGGAGAGDGIREEGAGANDEHDDGDDDDLDEEEIQTFERLNDLEDEATRKAVKRKWKLAWGKALGEQVNFGSPDVVIDPSPFTLSDLTPSQKVHFFFSMLGIHLAFCTSLGRLVGIITKETLMPLSKMTKK